jgi:hypothetical protein
VKQSATVPLLGGRDREVWIAAIILYGIGDTLTTLWGLSTGGVAEAGPVAKPLIEAYGQYMLLVIKAAIFPLFYLVWRSIRTPGRIAVPFALVLVGGTVTVWNLFVITGTL